MAAWVFGMDVVSLMQRGLKASVLAALLAGCVAAGQEAPTEPGVIEWRMEPPAEGSVAALRGGRIFADDTFLSLAPPVGAMPPARRVRLSPGAYARTLAWLRANPIPEAGAPQACDDHGRDEVSWSGAGNTAPDIRYSRSCPDPQMRALISGIVRVSGAPTMPRDGSDRSDRMKGFEIRYPGR